jgi:hypothetical protein
MQKKVQDSYPEGGGLGKKTTAVYKKIWPFIIKYVILHPIILRKII